MDASRLIEILPSLPKAELHVHLMGAIPRDTLVELLGRHDPQVVWGDYLAEQRETLRKIGPHILAYLEAPPERRSISSLFEYTDFPGFLCSHAFADRFVRSGDDFRLLVGSVARSLAAQGIVYAEITFCALAYQRRGISVEQIQEAFDEADRVEGITVRWLVDFVRDLGPEAAVDQARHLIEWREPRVVGVALGGSEHLYPARNYAEAFAIARDGGFRLTAHAGEAAGPESVREAVEVLGAERVGHGVSAAADPAVMELLRERSVTVEACVKSNLMTGACRTLAEHPLPAFVRSGITTTLNTDDPTFFESSYERDVPLALELGLSPAQVIALLRNGFSSSFMDERSRTSSLERFDREVERLQEGTPRVAAR